MAVEECNKHTNLLLENIDEVRELRKFKAIQGISGKVTSRNREVLYKSCIVLLVACWESYVEDLITHALEHLVNESSSPDKIPKAVLERVSSAHNGMKMWALAGEGWKLALKDNLQSVLAKTTGSFNTPRTAPVNDLFKKVLGLDNLSNNWSWEGVAQNEAEAKLDTLITLRGSIAHRVKASQTVKLQNVMDAEELVFCLSVRSHNTIVQFLKDQTGSSPWKRIKYKETR